MDFERYYGKKGTSAYNVQFVNDKGLRRHLIRQIFSPFGQIKYVNDRDKKYGICYVTYGNPDDCKRCIYGLQNHNFIKLLPYPNNEQDISPLIDNNHCSGNSIITSEEDNKKLIENMTSQAFLQNRKSEMISLNSSFSSIISNEKLKAFDNAGDQHGISDLNCISNNSTKDCIKKIIPAHEVIVANIHPKFGIHYILHLFERHNPLSVSCMKRMSFYGIRYCHVYFETQKEALATQEEFDGYSLCGNSLIVLTLHKLIEQAS